MRISFVAVCYPCLRCSLIRCCCISSYNISVFSLLCGIYVFLAVESDVVVSTETVHLCFCCSVISGTFLQSNQMLLYQLKQCTCVFVALWSLCLCCSVLRYCCIWAVTRSLCLRCSVVSVSSLQCGLCVFAAVWSLCLRRNVVSVSPSQCDRMLF